MYELVEFYWPAKENDLAHRARCRVSVRVTEDVGRGFGGRDNRSHGLGGPFFRIVAAARAGTVRITSSATQGHLAIPVICHSES